MKSIVDDINNENAVNGMINKAYHCTNCNNIFNYVILKRFGIEKSKIIKCPYCKTCYSVGKPFTMKTKNYLNQKHINYKNESLLELALRKKY